MNSKLIRFSFVEVLVILVMLSCFLVSRPSFALDDFNDHTAFGTTTYDVGSVLKLNGSWYINGAKVTASAATLNASASGLATNATQNATCSNLTVNGTYSFPSGVTGSSTLLTNATLQTVVISNVFAGVTNAYVVVTNVTLQTSAIKFVSGVCTNKP